MVDLNKTIDGDWGVDFSGRQQVNFTSFEMREKANGVWLLLTFANEAGQKASASYNLFTDDLTEGRQKANQITLGALGALFRAFGLSDADMPEKTPAGIKKALDAYAGNVAVSAMIGKDDRGYNQAGRFQKAG